jgi:hypothetical protein
MRSVASVLAFKVLLMASPAATEPIVFHTAHFGDDTVVNLSLVGNHAADRGGYDYEVLISLSETNGQGEALYSDPGKHRALVRCNPPETVAVRGIDYPVRMSGAGGDDWKDDLWRAVCETPVS